MTEQIITISRRHVAELIILTALFIPLPSLAGSIDSPSVPTDSGSAMHTLEGIYNQAATGTVSTKQSAFTEPTSGPGSTMHTLDDIQGALPAPENSVGASPADVTIGKKYWGLRTDGSWGPQTGKLQGSKSKQHCGTYVIPYMPYNANASQIIYISNMSTQASDVLVTAIDDQGTTYDLGSIGTSDANKVMKLAPLIKDKLDTQGFVGGKLAIMISTRAPNAIVYASYNVGGSDRGFVSVECRR